MKRIHLAVFAIINLFLFNAFAQEDITPSSPDSLTENNREAAPEIEESVIEALEKGQDNTVVNRSIQRNITIISAAKTWNLNPHTATYSSEAQVLDSLYEGLFSYHPKTLDPVPAVAESFKISRDKKRWTFTIRKDLVFSDGSPVTAFTVQKSWLALLKTKEAPYSSLLDCIKNAEQFRNDSVPEAEVGITARDNRTLVVSLNRPTAHLAKLLCHHAFAVCINENGEKCFSGAYVLSEQNGSSLILSRNEKYWNAGSVYTPQITIKSSDNLTENTYNFNTGAADWISGALDTKTIINKNSVRITAIFGTEYLFFTCKNKPWDNPDFRNALLTAVPWAKLRSLSLVPASTLIYPLAGYTGVEGFTETSVEDAVEMMKDARKEAGYSLTEKIPVIFGISMTSERHRELAEILKAAWEPLGIELKVQTTPEDRYIDSLPGWQADIFTYTWIGDFADPLAFLELFRGNSTLNQSRWNNQKYNSLIDEALLSNDNGQHYKLLAQAEQLLLDDGMIIPVSHSVSLHAINLNLIGGWWINALDIHPLKYLYIREDKTEDAPNII